MKNILLPTDFSNNSLNAIRYAVKLLKVEQCHFYILNVQRTSSFISDDIVRVGTSNTIKSTIVKAAQISIHNIIATLKEEYNNPKHSFSTIVDYDNFIEAINQTIKREQIDLIIMGTKGATGLKQVFFGSNTVKVIQRCHVPVLVIPDNYKFSKIYRSSMATSFKDPYTIKDIKIYRSIIALNKSEVHVLHIFCKNDKAMELSDCIDFFNSNFSNVKFKYLEVNNDLLEKAIKSYITNNKIDLMVMMKRPSSFINRFLNKDVVQHFVFSIPVPFLVLPKTM